MTQEEARQIAEGIQQWNDVESAAIATPWYVSEDDTGGHYVVVTLSDGRTLQVTEFQGLSLEDDAAEAGRALCGLPMEGGSTCVRYSGHQGRCLR